jgi:copper(I)-binding protein
MRRRTQVWSISLVVLAIALASAMPGLSIAGEPKGEPDQIGRLQIIQPWTARARAGGTARLRMEIVNDGSDDLHVIDITSPIAARVRLAVAGVPGKRVQLPSITLLAHESVIFDASRLSVTLEGLTRDLRDGERFPLTFHMAPHGQITTTVTVGSPARGGAS